MLQSKGIFVSYLTLKEYSVTISNVSQTVFGVRQNKGDFKCPFTM
jgi:hypothetical protein